MNWSPSVLMATALSAAAVYVATTGDSMAGARRLRQLGLVSPIGAAHGGSSSSLPARRVSFLRSSMASARIQRLVAGFAGCSCAVVAGGFPGVLLGLIVAIGVDRGLSRMEPAASRRRRERLAADMPVAADLLAACLLAGATLVDAAESVAVALGGPLGAELRGTIASVRLGADPAEAWMSFAGEPALAPLGRSLARAVDSGAPLAATMARLADDQRGERRRAAAAAAQRVGVMATLPLGVCFLPAFVLLGVVPVIGAVAGRVLGG